MFHERTNHINIKMHYIRDIIAQDIVSVMKVVNEDNPTDILTKVVYIAKLKHCLNLVNIDC